MTAAALFAISWNWQRASDIWRRHGNDFAARICHRLAEDYYSIAEDIAIDEQITAEQHRRAS